MPARPISLWQRTSLGHAQDAKVSNSKTVTRTQANVWLAGIHGRRYGTRTFAGAGRFQLLTRLGGHHEKHRINPSAVSGLCSWFGRPHFRLGVKTGRHRQGYGIPGQGDGGQQRGFFGTSGSGRGDGGYALFQAFKVVTSSPPDWCLQFPKVWELETPPRSRC